MDVDYMEIEIIFENHCMDGQIHLEHDCMDNDYMDI